MPTRTFAAVMIALGLAVTGLRAATGPDLVRIYTPDRAAVERVLSSGLDAAHVRPGAWIEVLARPGDRDRIESLGLRHETLVRGIGRVKAERNRAALGRRLTFGNGSMGGFYTHDEAMAVIDSLLNNDPNGIIAGPDTLGTGHRGGAVVMFKISDNPGVDEDEPEILYDAVHHAREPMGMMSLLYFVEYLLAGYGSDPEVTHLVDSREMYFIPFVNPDGYAVNESVYFEQGEFGYWRKNARDNNGNGVFDEDDGVDLNRNYGYMWGFDNIGSSPDPTSAVYRGPGPFSEPETGAIRTFCWGREFLLGLNYHSYSDLLIYPWGYNDAETPDSLSYREVAENLTRFNNYQYGTGMETVGYQTNGDADDWMYGEQVEKPKILSMTPEVGHAYDGFYPPAERILPLAQENLQANLALARTAGGWARVDGEPAVDDSGGDGNGHADPGETVDIRIGLRNAGLTTTLTGIQAVLSSPHPMVHPVVPTASFGDLAPLGGTSDNSGDPFRVTLDDSIPPGERITFRLDLTADGGYASRDSFHIIAGTPLTLFADGAEADVGNFDAVGWGIDSRYAHAGAASFSDSPGGNYPGNARTTLTLKTGLDMSEPGHAWLLFHARWFIEKDWDIVKVQASRDGTSWTTLPGTNSFPGSGFESYHDPSEEGYHSTQMFFEKETVDLSAFTGPGNGDVRFRFILQSDGWVEFDGFYVDDIRVDYYPAAGAGIGDTGPVPPGLPRAFALEQNYPNPFNPSTTIEAAIPPDAAGPVTLRIFDLRGRLVRTLVSGDLAPGVHRFAWDGTTGRGEPVPSGAYFYTLEAGERTLTRKMILAK
jgi:hypothetical protein